MLKVDWEFSLVGEKDAAVQAEDFGGSGDAVGHRVCKLGRFE